MFVRVHIRAIIWANKCRAIERKRRRAIAARSPGWHLDVKITERTSLPPPGKNTQIFKKTQKKTSRQYYNIYSPYYLYPSAHTVFIAYIRTFACLYYYTRTHIDCCVYCLLRVRQADPWGVESAGVKTERPKREEEKKTKQRLGIARELFDRFYRFRIDYVHYII